MKTAPPPMPKGAGPVMVLESDGGCHVFGFAVFDDTPGGGNLGRIEWHVELFPHSRHKGTFRGLMVWASQTRDPRYRHRFFWLPSITEGISGHRFSNDGTGRTSFVERVWRIAPCRDHGHIVLSAYPEDHHRDLCVELISSLASDLTFRPVKAER